MILNKKTLESPSDAGFSVVSVLLSDVNNYFTSDNVHYVKCNYFIISFYLLYTANARPVCICNTFTTHFYMLFFFYYTAMF